MQLGDDCEKVPEETIRSLPGELVEDACKSRGSRRRRMDVGGRCMGEVWFPPLADGRWWSVPEETMERLPGEVVEGADEVVVPAEGD